MISGFVVCFLESIIPLLFKFSTVISKAYIFLKFSSDYQGFKISKYTEEKKKLYTFFKNTSDNTYPI